MPANSLKSGKPSLFPPKDTLRVLLDENFPDSLLTHCKKLIMMSFGFELILREFQTKPYSCLPRVTNGSCSPLIRIFVKSLSNNPIQAVRVASFCSAFTRPWQKKSPPS